MELLELMKNRWSVRKYSDRPIEDEVLNKILEAGRTAPTGCNNQPQKIYVLKSEEAIKKATEATPCTYGAKIVLLCCYDNNVVWHSRTEDYNVGDQDVSIVVTHMMLEAEELGLGTCWVRAFDSHKVKELFELPENIVPVCYLDLGYKADNAEPNHVNHDNRKPLSETVVEL